MDIFDQFMKYMWHRIKAKNQHGIHSPFLFELYNNVITDQTPYYAFEQIEAVRAKLLLTRKYIKVNDYGAKPISLPFKNDDKKTNEDKRRISTIARRSLKMPKHGQLLFRLVNRFQPKTILELGTSLGVTTLYLAAPNQQAEVVTMEGCPNISKVAQITFDKVKVPNVKLVNKRFEEGLNSYLDEIDQLDFAFFDGNHAKEATLRYFNWCLALATPSSVFVFDDIYWSEEMMEAWDEIKKHPKVTTTIDLFAMGIVFFNTDLSKEDVKLKY